jgi:hypothetical protein
MRPHWLLRPGTTLIFWLAFVTSGMELRFQVSDTTIACVISISPTGVTLVPFADLQRLLGILGTHEDTILVFRSGAIPTVGDTCMHTQWMAI